MIDPDVVILPLFKVLIALKALVANVMPRIDIRVSTPMFDKAIF